MSTSDCVTTSPARVLSSTTSPGGIRDVLSPATRALSIGLAGVRRRHESSSAAVAEHAPPPPPPALPVDPLEGPLFVRHTSLWTALGGRKRWVARFAQLCPHSGTLALWASKGAHDRGQDPLSLFHLHTGHALGPLKEHALRGDDAVAAVDEAPPASAEELLSCGDLRAAPQRVYYRALLDTEDVASCDAGKRHFFGLNLGFMRLGTDGASLRTTHSTVALLPRADTGISVAAVLDAGTRKLLHLGAESSSELDIWTRAILGCMCEARARETAARVNAAALAAAAASCSSDMLYHALAAAKTGSPPLPSLVTLSIALVDGSDCAPLTLPSSACARDAVIILTQRLGVRAHGDFALAQHLPHAPSPLPPGLTTRIPSALANAAVSFIRETRVVFIPDVVSVGELSSRVLSAPATHLVLRRRLSMPSRIGGGSSSSSSAAASASDPSEAVGVDPSPPPPSSEASGGEGEGSTAWLSRAEAAALRACAEVVAGRTLYPPGDVMWRTLSPNADIEAEAAAASGPRCGALRLLFLEACAHVTRGELALPLLDAIHFAGLQLLVECGPVEEDEETLSPHTLSACSEREEETPSLTHDSRFYGERLQRLLSPQAFAQAYAETSAAVVTIPRTIESATLDRLTLRVRDAHACASLACAQSPFAGMRAYCARVNQHPCAGGTFFRTFLVRGALTDEAFPASLAPAWAQGATGDTPLPVLVCVHVAGVSLRPAPPAFHADAREALYEPHSPLASLVVASLPSSGGASLYTAPLDAIDSWGVKRTRPAFTVRVREATGLMLLEVTTPSYLQLTAALGGIVYRLFVQREGRRVRSSAYPTLALSGGGCALPWHAIPQDDLIVGAVALSTSVRAASERAHATAEGAGGEWAEIVCPGSGALLLWRRNSQGRVVLS